MISRRSEATRLGASYAAGLTTAHILAAGAVSLMIVSLTRNSGDSPSILSSRRNLIALWTGRCLVTFETSPYSFVDLVGSTAIAAARPPEEVAEILNDFFRIVVATVHQRHGLINKFEGDAVLAVFGAPIDIDEPASAALATARGVGTDLIKLPLADFGIGVAAGAVFAGNIGAENRYEYTVIGDAVNEAARLADHAKQWESRILASGSALACARAEEREHWATRGSVSLRGRSAITELAEPVLTD